MTSADLNNQPALRGDLDLLGGDPALLDHGALAGADAAHLDGVATQWGRAAFRETARQAERNLPEARLIDKGGRRLDEVAFHPAYHHLMEAGLSAGYAALPWQGTTGGHATHAAMVYLMSQIEPGVCCPMTMTYAAVPALDASAALSGVWRPKLTAGRYDPTVGPVAGKAAATMGMAMTERAGGSDVRSNQTRAVRDGETYLLTGQKWFCSAPMSDGFLTLAQAPEGLTCFLVPRWLDGDRNAIRIERLKDKLGNRSNASAEIAYEGAMAHRLGDEGAGVRMIIEMVHHTRLDTAVAPAGLMRAALAEAHYWVARRNAFQRLLIDQPLMRALLADLVLDWEGATALALHTSAAFDRGDRAFARIAVALAKFLNNKLCGSVVAEAMEILGGMGYVEDTPLPMLYREAPLNGIWEGSGNVICLDILRTLAKDPGALEALHGELQAAIGGAPAYDAALAAFEARWRAPEEREARAFATQAARLLTASVLLRKAPDAVAQAYTAGRLADGRSGVAGAEPLADPSPILERLGPAE